MREVFIATSTSVEARSFLRTDDGGFALAGSAANLPWVTKVDAEGTVAWVNELAIEGRTPSDSSRYEGVVALKNGYLLLCGYSRVSRPRYSTRGLLAVLNERGSAITTRFLKPFDDEKFGSSELTKCIRWDDKVAILGTATVPASRPELGIGEYFNWILVVDGSGRTIWQKAIPARGSPDITLGYDGSLVLLETFNEGSAISKFDTGGVLRAERKISYRAQTAHAPAQSSVLVLVSLETGNLLALNDRLEDVEKVKGVAWEAEIQSAVFRLNDKTLVAFGSHRLNSALTASISTLTADLRSVRIYSLQPLWTSGKVDDVIPGSGARDFVTMRSVRQIPRWPEDRRHGVVLALVSVR